MDKQLILVPSVTYALKAKSVLDKYKIKAYIERTPRNHQIRSCSYCVFVPHDTVTATELLLRHKIKILGRIAREEL